MTKQYEVTLLVPEDIYKAFQIGAAKLAIYTGSIASDVEVVIETDEEAQNEPS